MPIRRSPRTPHANGATSTSRRRRSPGALGATLLVAAAALRPVNPAVAEAGGGPEEIPRVLVEHYQRAAATCTGLPWEVVAAIGWVESRHAYGRIDPESGETPVPIQGPPLDGEHGTMAIPDASFPSGWMHALGPMQFLPTTWVDWARLGHGRPTDAVPSPHNAFDAIASAGAYLCGGNEDVGELRRAILRYNYDNGYVAAVLAKAERYGWPGDDDEVDQQEVDQQEVDQQEVDEREVDERPVDDGVVVGTDPTVDPPADPTLDTTPADPARAVCPVPGPVDLHDDFGEERAGGVRHEGNDLYAPPGAVVVAPEAGEIVWATEGQRAIRTPSGGVWVLIHNPYDGDDPSLPAAGTPVTAGTPIARVGRTAWGQGLLHIEWRPDGHTAEDAESILRPVCLSPIG